MRKVKLCPRTKQNEKSKGICVNFSMRIESGRGRVRAKWTPAMRHKRTKLKVLRDRTITGGQANWQPGGRQAIWLPFLFFYVIMDKLKNCRLGDWWRFSFNICACMELRVCSLSVSKVCAKGYKTVYTQSNNTKSARRLQGSLRKILLTSIFVQLFSNNFVMRFACHAPLPKSPLRSVINACSLAALVLVVVVVEWKCFWFLKVPQVTQFCSFIALIWCKTFALHLQPTPPTRSSLYLDF